MAQAAINNPIPAIEMTSMMSPADTKWASLVRDWLSLGKITEMDGVETESNDLVSFKCTYGDFSVIVTIYKIKGGSFWIWAESGLTRIEPNHEQEILKYMLEAQYDLVAFKLALQPATGIIVLQLRDSLPSGNLLEKLNAFLNYSDYIFEELQNRFPYLKPLYQAEILKK